MNIVGVDRVVVSATWFCSTSRNDTMEKLLQKSIPGLRNNQHSHWLK